ncbi:MAG: tRNA uridine-5-carboxymethylaminomethyl(34) synthesis GTPase MnmE [Oscillospiraceae bacterium]|jgi:tRNA modification GTPase|nr:tRNA uridine-5-carboxymethylaminomethyl(34) synthesis GTPase MnmE [Oscillospiraceae bacterium]
MDTIAAIATPRAVGGLSIIRVSGESAVNVARKVFMPVSGEVMELKSHTAVYGNIFDSEEKIDDGMLTIFFAPNSYTGENVAEISCHGGIYVTERVLRACLNAGARLAGAGEFTKRALLNGKLSLTQAESVIDIINSHSKQYLTCSLAQREGALFRKTEEISSIILDITVQIAAWIDYPDESLDSFETSSFLGQLADCRTKLQLLLESFEVGRIMREGVLTAIVGKPNAGKSTLMNQLTKSNRSIVTDIAGTTRDIIEESVNIGEIILRLCDCAGLRDTEDLERTVREVEEIGINNMLNRLEQCELALAVFDNSRPLEKEDYTLIEKLKGKTVICVINKADLENRLDLTYLATQFGSVVEITAKDEASFEPLTSVICKTLQLGRVDMSAGFIANERQRECAAIAESALERAIDGILAGYALDMLGVTLESALESLYELSGKSVSETVIDEVFRRFCVGK